MVEKSLHELGMYEITDSVEEIVSAVFERLEFHYKHIVEDYEMSSWHDYDDKELYEFAQEKLKELETFKQKHQL